MQEADESVAQGAQGLMMQVAGGAVVVVEGACSWTVRESAEGPLVDGAVESPVAAAARVVAANAAGAASASVRSTAAIS